MELSQSVKLKASAAEVWSYVSDFYNYAEWQPHIASIERGEKDGERVVHMKRGNTVLDRVVERDEASRKLSYGLVPGQPTPPGVPKLEDMLATFVVADAGGKAEVAYTISVTVPDEIRPMAEKGIGADIAGALQGLKDRFGEA
jgi:hypothetical protein